MDIYYNFMGLGEFCVNVDISETVGSLKHKLVNIHGKCNVCIISDGEEFSDDTFVSSLNLSEESIIFNQKCVDCEYAEDAVINRHLDCLKLCNMETSKSNGYPYCSSCVSHKCNCVYTNCYCVMPYCDCHRDIMCPMGIVCNGCDICFNDSSRLGILAFELGDYVALEYILDYYSDFMSNIIDHWEIIKFPDDDELLECMKILSKYEKNVGYGIYVKMLQEDKLKTLKYLFTLQPGEFIWDRWLYNHKESSDPRVATAITIVERSNIDIGDKFINFVIKEIPDLGSEIVSLLP
jgi:hypothetical protein